MCQLLIITCSIFHNKLIYYFFLLHYVKGDLDRLNRGLLNYIAFKNIWIKIIQNIKLTKDIIN